ncbi:MAG TPA: AAC(3) family N-acetyltransferase [Limnochordia bacterium]|nr:AAC(3) family N-acetyltransferase [Limnochordia bacterium]
MYTKRELQQHLEKLGVVPSDTVLVHSSMKAIGDVEGGADTVLHAFGDFLKLGLLVLPTHTWEQINATYNIYDVLHEPSCVGLLTNLFRQRPDVLRSWHPTHSVAALGQDAADYVQGEENIDTPCGRKGCWGKLYDRKAKVLFLGVPLSRNTLIHGVEEWACVPRRLTDDHTLFKIRTPDGRLLDRPMRRHSSPISDISKNYDKLAEPLLKRGIAVQGKFGDAQSTLIEVEPMVDLTLEFLRRDPDLFLDQEPVPKEWYSC